MTTSLLPDTLPRQPADWRQLGLEERLQVVLPELIQLRRHLHRHPELSGHEHQTAALVAGELRRWGWEVLEGVGRTGVVAELGRYGRPADRRAHRP
jgi:metal-dependent amidase/aminoacylase/carboxypeptidase family protein